MGFVARNVGTATLKQDRVAYETGPLFDTLPSIGSGLWKIRHVTLPSNCQNLTATTRNCDREGKSVDSQTLPVDTLRNPLFHPGCNGQKITPCE